MVQYGTIKSTQENKASTQETSVSAQEMKSK